MFQLGRKLIKLAAILAGGLCLWVVFERSLPDPKVPVDAATTFITQPLTPDGLPDYAHHLIAPARAGVTPENNAAVLMWQATWPGEVPPEYQRAYCDDLGMSLPANTPKISDVIEDEELLERIEERLKEEGQISDLAAGSVREFVERTDYTPWTADQMPELAEWMDQREAAFELLIAASERTHYYAPRLELLKPGSRTPLTFMHQPDLSALRAACRELARRAMWRVAEGRGSEAWRDLRAIYRLTNLLQPASLIEHLVKLGTVNLAHEGTIRTLHEIDFSPYESREILREIQKLLPPAGVEHLITNTERILNLDILSRLANGQINFNDLSNESNATGDQSATLPRARIDWRIAFREANQIYDRLGHIAKLPRQERVQRFSGFDEELMELRPMPWSYGTSLISCRARSQSISRILLLLNLPAAGAAMRAQDRCHCDWQLRQAAAALAVYRAEAGHYPEKLSELVPGILPSLPVDIYTEKPLIYERRGEGYLLYSLFENGTDEGGDQYGSDDEIVDGEWVPEPNQVTYEKSDWVIRVPAPPFVAHPASPDSTQPPGEIDSTANP